MAITTRRKEIYEILQQVSTAKNKAERVKILKANAETWPLLDVLRGTFDDTVQWNLPDGTPPYTPAEESSVPTSLNKEHMKFKYFVKGLRESNQLHKLRRERMFIDMLETVHPRDAEVLVSMINKKSPVKGLTKKLVQEALPELIQD